MIEISEDFADGRRNNVDRLVAHNAAETFRDDRFHVGHFQPPYPPRDTPAWGRRMADFYAAGAASACCSSIRRDDGDIDDFERENNSDDSYLYFECPTMTATSACHAAAMERTPCPPDSRFDEYGPQCVLVREIFGDPFHPVVVEDRWRTADVVTLAAQIYDAKSFDSMKDLAMLLADAGCTSEPLLEHCRRAEGHVRGCWALDLLLGKR